MDDPREIKRLKIGIIFNFSPGWMGGVIYILNLIKTLDFLDDKEKPEIMLFYSSDLKKFVDEINYPYFKKLEWKFPSVYKGYLQSWLFCKNTFVNEILGQNDLDGLYPLLDYPVKTKTRTRLVCWYADLQHKYYPDFFTWRKIFERNARIRFMIMNSQNLVVSSKAVSNDFERYFRLRKGLKMHIFHFVSVIDNFENLHIEDLKKKYRLPEKYFMISNQFHKHKNHKILLITLASLKEKGNLINFVMTGRFPEASHSPYMQELHAIINEHQLQTQIVFLGIIPRNEQLLLMKYSQAILQPSLFEGWSTVIEDAKSLQVPVVASNLPVNIEQLGNDGRFFDPHDHEELAAILSSYPERNIHNIFYDDYTKRIKEAAKDFIKLFL
jgi:glycosyltransferase involved in cell wall biosynthesis